MTKTTFKIAKRSARKAKQLRRLGILPANVYIPRKSSIALEIDPREFKKLHQELGETGLVYLEIEGEKKAIPTLIDQVDMDYLGIKYEHVVFRAVDLKEKIKAEVPVEVVGEIDIPEAVLIVIKDSVEVEALPTDFPEKFVLDVSGLKAVGDNLTLVDLDYNHDEITLVLGEDEDPSKVTLLAIQQQQEEEVEEVSEELLEPEIAGEEKTADEADVKKKNVDEKIKKDQKPAESSQKSE